MLKSLRSKPSNTTNEREVLHVEVVEVSDLNLVQIQEISPLRPQWIVIRWIYIERESSSHLPMQNFAVRDLYLKESDVYVRDFHCKLSKRDSFMFRFLLNLGFKLHLKCISDVFRGKDNRFYQVCYLCI